MDLSSIPDGLAAVTAGVLLVALLLSVLIVWHRRSAEGLGAGQDAALWGGAQSWTSYAVTDIPEDDELPPAGWERTMARQRRERPEVAELVDHLELPEETVAFAHVPSPRSGDADRVERPTPRPTPRPAPPVDRPDQGVPDRGTPDRGTPDRAMPDRAMPDRAMPDRAMPDRGMSNAGVRGMSDPGVQGRGAQGGGRSAGGPQGDLRDRLFAVVLGDYDTVVGVLDELAACQKRLGQLSVATDRERSALGAALSRLAATGLRPDQLSRLADIPLDEVHRLLDPVGADANS